MHGGLLLCFHNYYFDITALRLKHALFERPNPVISTVRKLLSILIDRTEGTSLDGRAFGSRRKEERTVRAGPRVPKLFRSRIT